MSGVERQYVRPTVRALPMPTAHPTKEAWGDAGRAGGTRAPSAEDRSVRFAQLQQRMTAIDAATQAGRAVSSSITANPSAEPTPRPPETTTSA